MTSDHQAISTMHTPLPKQQQVSAKGLHQVCNDLGASSLADSDSDQCLAIERDDCSHAQVNENGESMVVNSSASEQNFKSVNGTIDGDCEVQSEQIVTVANGRSSDGLHNDGGITNPSSCHNPEGNVTNIYERSDFVSSDPPNVNVDQLHPREEQFSSLGDSQTVDLPVSPSLADPVALSDGQSAHESIGLMAADTGGVQTTPWPGYDMSLDDLRTRVRHQLEFYFSRENLASDAYLRSQMDNDQFVKVTVLANFNMVRRLTTDMNLILQALRESTVLQVDEAGEKVRPVHKRCTLILREIPEDTEKKEVEDLFASPDCPKIISCEYALNNIWYVNFETDEDAQKAFLYLRQQVQSFKGRPILARIKTAPIPRVQNGFRPVPPNALPLQNSQHGTSTGGAAPTAVTTIISPVAEAPTIPLAFSTSAVCTPPGAAGGVVGVVTAPGDAVIGCGAVCTNSVTLPGSAAVAAMPTSNIYYYSTGGAQPAAIVAPAAGPSAVVATPTAAAVISPTWPPASPSFDLGYILAVNGYQPQGAYRPALLVPAASIPAQVAAAVGHRFVADRPPRRPRPSGNFYTSRTTDRAMSNGADSGPSPLPSSYNRYGSSSATRPSAEGRSSYHRNDQNIHYNNIRNRPSRQGSANGSGASANGVAPRRYQPRGGGERYPGADYWSSSTSSTKDRKTRSNLAANSASAVSGGTGTNAPDGKKIEAFDLQSSSFPPLPTANSDHCDQSAAVDSDPEPNAEVEDTPIHSTIGPSQQVSRKNKETTRKDQLLPVANGVGSVVSPATATATATAKVHPQAQQQSPGEIVDRTDPSKQTSACSSSPVIRQPQVPTTAVMLGDEENQANLSAAITRSSKATELVNMTSITTHESQLRDQKVAQKPSLSTITTAAGAVIRGGTNTTIPVAVVVPNAQPKPQRVTTADKATVTDSLSHFPKKGVTEGKSSSVATMTSNAQHNVCGQTDDKSSNDYAKRLSYAEMAKHAAARNAGFTLAHSNASPAEKPDANCTGALGPAASSSAGGGREQRANNDEGTRRWGTSSRGGGGNFGAVSANGKAAQTRGSNSRESSNKYNSTRKQSKPYRKRDYQQQQQEYSLSPHHAVSPTPSSS